MPTFTPAHIGINVTDLDRSCAFYTQVFGLTVDERSTGPGPQWAFLADEQDVVLTLWQQSEGRHPTARPGLHHLAFVARDIAEVHAVERLVRSLGVRFHHDGVVPHGEGESSGGIFFEDPDGLRLELYADTGADQDRSAPRADVPTCGFF